MRGLQIVTIAFVVWLLAMLLSARSSARRCSSASARIRHAARPTWSER